MRYFSIVSAVFLTLSIAFRMPVYAQQWSLGRVDKETADAFEFYRRLVEEFKKTKHWPPGGDTAHFVIDRDRTRTPEVLGYFLPNDNAIHLFADTATVMRVLRSSMENPTRQEMLLLLHATLLVHEFSGHWRVFNDSRQSRGRHLKERFYDAFENKRLRDSISFPYLLNGIAEERDTYILVLRFLKEHVARGEFTRKNFSRAVVSSATGFYEQYHNPTSINAKFLHNAAENVVRYEAKPQQTADDKYAIAGYNAMVKLITNSLHQIYLVDDTARQRERKELHHDNR